MEHAVRGPESSEDPRDAATPSLHVAVFYDSDAFLADSIVRFLAPGLAGGEAAIVVATPAHIRMVEAALGEADVDVQSARRRAQLLCLDAAEVLATFCDDGVIDHDRFLAVVGGLLQAATETGRRVRIYGEMVALLWAEGHVAAVLELEDLWNRIGREQSLALLCGYPSTQVSPDQDASQFRAVCERHSAVIPGSGTGVPPGPNPQLEAVALLQQAPAGDAEDRESLQKRERALTGALRRLRDRDRARSEFTAMVAHEIRSPAGTAGGYLGLLREHWEDLDDGEIARYLGIANRKLEQIERLAEDLLTVMEIDAGAFRYDLRPVDLEAVIAEVTEEIGHASGRTIVVDCRHGPRLVLADEVRQSQILSNLLSNAVKYSPDDAAVTVTTEHDRDSVTVRVRDRGDGIATSDFDHLFEPFARLESRNHARSGGSGLGLHITRALVNGQGGRLWVESEPGSGSTFAYRVPLVAPLR